MRKTFEDRLCSILVMRKVLSLEEAQALQKDFKCRSNKERFEEFLLNEGFIEKRLLLDALSEYYQVPAFDVVGHMFDGELISFFPKEILMSRAVIPVELDQDLLVVVAGDPNDENLARDLAEYVSYEIQCFVGIRQDILDMIVDIYDHSLFEDSDGNDIENNNSEEYIDDRFFDDVFDQED